MTVIGKQTKKCIAYSTAKKSCRMNPCKCIRNLAQSFYSYLLFVRANFRYTQDAMLRNLTSLESTNQNENLNMMISRKTSKAVTHSESESLDFRVAAAVLQKNEGRWYLSEVRH